MHDSRGMPRMRANRLLLAAIYSPAHQPSTAVDENSEVNANTQGQTTVAMQTTGVQTMHSPLTDWPGNVTQHRVVSNSAMMHVLMVARRGAPVGQAAAETQLDGRASCRPRGLHMGTPQAWSQALPCLL